MLLAIRSLDGYHRRMMDIDNVIRLLEGAVVLIALIEGVLGLVERVQKKRER